MLTLVTFVVVSVAVSSVVDSAARRRAQAIAARAEADTLAGAQPHLLAGEHDVRALLDLVRGTFGAAAAELRRRRRDGRPAVTRSPTPPATPCWCCATSNSTPAEQRVLAAFAAHLGVLREREELARQTAAARELEAGNRTRTALLAAVSHDLRTPLAGLRAAASTLRRHDADLSAADRADLLEAIETSTARLSRMVADLLDMSRLQTGAVEPVLTAAPVLDVVTAALAELGDRHRVRVVPPLPEVTADLGLLARVIVNLVGNGLRHTDGPVEVTGHDRRVARVRPDRRPRSRRPGRGTGSAVPAVPAPG